MPNQTSIQPILTNLEEDISTIDSNIDDAQLYVDNVDGNLSSLFDYNDVSFLNEIHHCNGLTAGTHTIATGTGKGILQGQIFFYGTAGQRVRIYIDGTTSSYVTLNVHVDYDYEPILYKLYFESSYKIEIQIVNPANYPSIYKQVLSM